MSTTTNTPTETIKIRSTRTSGGPPRFAVTVQIDGRFVRAIGETSTYLDACAIAAAARVSA